MKKIRLLLEYKCYPLWIYDENGELLDNDLVDELRSEKEIVEKLMEIQRVHDSLFIDDSITFEYKGFAEDSIRASYIEKIENVLILLKEKLGERYIIKNDIAI
ncbi:hypothetical protein [Gottfriedia solisilvae]|uniref:hypothetical protein n=1 Tax=Gottfriedia solisilvae TaxID=1516104 RepID=UPI003D2F5149